MLYQAPQSTTTPRIARIARHLIPRLPQPRLHYPPRDPGYFEAAELSREMSHP